jgi:hypothetical protein
MITRITQFAGLQVRNDYLNCIYSGLMSMAIHSGAQVIETSIMYGPGSIYKTYFLSNGDSYTFATRVSLSVPSIRTC